ncbi:glucuronate isomerase [Fulvivirga lutimaris]|uniref:glucuronate isomerase n=1 Tax=Fulvivirga lutimaris TaxID=1819566 RepID=UPI0012BCE0A9|nr:glucuronate isomerase [Fulvivirga lutimaris]MTI39383.1 glucuronate isomerase [Fulvivirga lutimaris]
MNGFIGEDFLLESNFARELYHDFASDLPILDYHCHLPPSEIACNRQFNTITELWIEGDHYKWRAMRQLGIDENLITGAASDYQKFEAWSKTVPYALRNPLYHWTHLELKRYFYIDETLNGDTASAIYEEVNKKLAKPEFFARGLVDKMNVELICSTDDPLDDLSAHKQMSNMTDSFQLLPTFRPDRAIHIDQDGFIDYLSSLSNLCDVDIKDWDSLKEALSQRMDFFHEAGCRLADHGLNHAYGENFEDVEINKILIQRLSKGSLSANEILKYKSAVLCFLGESYAQRNWTMQLHLGPIRNANKALLKTLGIDAGVDSIGDFRQADQLAAFLNRLNEKDLLPKTVLYNSNPADNEVFATMAGNFSETGVKGKVQFGAAWWFLDQKSGIEKQIDSLSNLGMLSTSIGMLTDSRSFLSFPRHEYYRRILCNTLGNDIKSGLLPNDTKWIGKVVQDICYYNAKDFFKFSNPKESKKIF